MIRNDKPLSARQNAEIVKKRINKFKKLRKKLKDNPEKLSQFNLYLEKIKNLFK
jgi:prefoldin subunit 5